MKELKRDQIRTGAHFDSDYEIERTIQAELTRNYFLNLAFSVYHKANGRAHLSEDLKDKAREIALDMEERGFPHPFVSPDWLKDLIREKLS